MMIACWRGALTDFPQSIAQFAVQFHPPLAKVGKAEPSLGGEWYRKHRHNQS